MRIQACPPAAENDALAPATGFFDDLKAQLRGKVALEMIHGDAERLLQMKGTELPRLLYQGWLDQGAPGEAAAPVVGAEGVRRPHARLERGPRVGGRAFPRDRRILDSFFDELARRLDGDEKAGSFTDLLDRLEEPCEALLIGEAHGLERR